jgi:LPS-assembly lipoprotein
MSFRTLLVVSLALLLSACGFHLRGQADLPFSTLYVDGDQNSSFVNELERAISAGSNTQLVDQAAQAEAVLQILSETREKKILSLSGGGRVREFQLNYRVAFRLHDSKGGDLIPNSEIALKRDISFSDTQVLAKESEEALLYRDMQSDAVQQILRRLRAVRAK